MRPESQLAPGLLPRRILTFTHQKPRRSAVNYKIKSFKLSWALATMMALVLGLGCNRGGGSSESKIVKLAFVTNNPSQFWKIAAGGIKKYEAEAKVQVD